MESHGNWLALLKWSLAQQGDGTQPSNVSTLSAEDKAFLEQVMKEAVRDDGARLNEIMHYLIAVLEGCTINEETEQKLEVELEELREITEQIDMAQVFTKFGGVNGLLGVIERNEISVENRGLAASALATISQNNLIVQEAFYQQHHVERLVQLFLVSTSELLCTKLLLAISSSVRGHAAAEERFVQASCTAVIQKTLQVSMPKVATRLLFLCNALIGSDCSSVARITKLCDFLVPGVLQFIGVNHDVALREALLQLLLTIVQTEHGWMLLSTQHRSAFDVAVATRLQLVLEPKLDEQNTHELAILQEVRARVDRPVQALHPKAVAAASAGSATLSQAVNGAIGASTTANISPALALEPVQQDVQEQQEVLLLEPPKLQASSPMP